MLESSTSTEVRQLRFPLPADLDPQLVPGDPAASRLMVGLTLLIAYLEPYLIRSMQVAKHHVADMRLREEISLFCGQEAQHYRQHLRFNQVLRRGEAGPALLALEQELERDYRRFTAQRSLRFNLAYAEGFEAFTTAVSLFAFEVRLDLRLHDAVRDLFRWHVVEELEHRTVAFDVYQQVGRGYVYRLGVGLFAQWHLVRFAMRVAKVLAREQAAASAPVSASEPGLARLALRRLLPRVLATYLPWYSPHGLRIPDEARAFAAHYTELARQLEPS